MVKSNFKQIDLLRKRRGSSNLPDQYFIDTNKFIKKGIYSGLILISISLILGIPFIFRTKFLENQNISLAINIHSFSEMAIDFIKFWIKEVISLRIPYLFIVPNAGHLYRGDLISFDNKNFENIINNSKKNNIEYEVIPEKEKKYRSKLYSDNFRFDRKHPINVS